MNLAETTALLTRLYAAQTAKDIATIDAMLGPDFTMHVGGAHPLSGTYRGREEVWPYLAKAAAALEGRATGGWEIHAITADDDGHAVALLRGFTGDFSRPIVHVWHIKDGLLAEYWDVAMDQVKEDTFWLSVVPA